MLSGNQLPADLPEAAAYRAAVDDQILAQHIGDADDIDAANKRAQAAWDALVAAATKARQA